MSVWISAGGEGAVVDADFVDEAAEELAGQIELPPIRSGPLEVSIVAAAGLAGDLDAVDEERAAWCRRRWRRGGSRC